MKVLLWKHLGVDGLLGSLRMFTPLFIPNLPLQEDAEKQEGVATVPAPMEAGATEVHSQEEEASLTADALPEILQMMTDIQAALTPAEGLNDTGMGADEASADEGSLQILLFILMKIQELQQAHCTTAWMSLEPFAGCLDTRDALVNGIITNSYCVQVSH